MNISLKEEKLAQEMFKCVMKNIPWDHNVQILQSIYRKISKHLIKKYKINPK